MLSPVIFARRAEHAPSRLPQRSAREKSRNDKQRTATIHPTRATHLFVGVQDVVGDVHDELQRIGLFFQGVDLLTEVHAEKRGDEKARGGEAGVSTLRWLLDVGVCRSSRYGCLRGFHHLCHRRPSSLMVARVDYLYLRDSPGVFNAAIAGQWSLCTSLCWTPHDLTKLVTSQSFVGMTLPKSFRPTFSSPV